MSGFLGTRGALAELQYRGGLSTKTDRPVTFTRTLGGKRKAMLGSRGRREWDVSFDLIASRDTLGLVEIARSAGEVMWYPADAVAGNLLSPQASQFEVTQSNATAAGMVALPDGTVARSVVPNSGAAGVLTVGDAHGGFERVPVRAGETVSFGGWGVGGIRFTGSWYSAAGSVVGSVSTAALSFSGWGWGERSIVVPAGAAFVSLVLSQGTQYARPSVAWGGSAKDRPGRGCPKAVVHGLSEALTTITDDAHGSVAVTITEVG